MGREEISHQQVMSYLVGGGDYYCSHGFRSFRFYEFLKESRRDDAARRDRSYGNDDLEDHQQQEEEVLVDVSSGEAAVASDVLDYRYRPSCTSFDNLSVWEFFERTREVWRVQSFLPTQ